MQEKIIIKVPKTKEGEATYSVAGKVKITENYQDILEGNFDSCGSAYSLTAESTVKLVEQIKAEILGEFEKCKKDIEDFIGISYLPGYNEADYPKDRKFTLDLKTGIAVAFNHALYIIEPEIKVFNNSLDLLDNSNFQIYYNTPTSLTIISNIDLEEAIVYIISK